MNSGNLSLLETLGSVFHRLPFMCNRRWEFSFFAYTVKKNVHIYIGRVQVHVSRQGVGLTPEVTSNANKSGVG